MFLSRKVLCLAHTYIVSVLHFHRSQFIRLNDEPQQFTPSDTQALLKANYDPAFHREVYETATLVGCGGRKGLDVWAGARGNGGLVLQGSTVAY
jgi:hypothetical protein